MYKLLDGVRIIDLTTVVLGPYATQFLGDFGAEVIKIEPPQGDLFRYVKPGRTHDMGAGFLNLNRNKKSLALDLKSDSGRSQMTNLIKGADVFVHNMRRQAADKLALDYETVRLINPDIVYCAAPGFSSDGPYGDRPAYDDIIQAESGLAHLNANDKGEPRFLPTILCDKVAGLHLAIAITSGIAAQARTGSGCCVEVPMFESLVSFMMAEQLAGCSFVPPMGSLGYERLLSPHRKPFKTSDNYISVIPYNARHWENFLNFVGREDIATADWVQDTGSRSANIDQLYQIISEALCEESSEYWLRELEALDIPCSRVNSLEDLLCDPHLQETGFFFDYDHPTEGTLKRMRSPFRVTGVNECQDLPPPRLNGLAKTAPGS